jgi:hypothetical protein
MTIDDVCSCCGSTASIDAVTLHARPEIAICSDCLDGLVGQRARRRAAQAGKACVTGFEPIFNVDDVPRAVEHYERIGFETSMHDDTYAFAHRGDLTLHLALAEEGTTAGASSLYLHVDDADQLAEEWRAVEVDVFGPNDEDYGKREGSHVDADGNLIRFGSPLRR